MLTLLIGTDWIESRNALLRMMAEDVSSQKDNCILIVPELISHDTERRLCEFAGDTACRYAEVLSFSRLVQRVAESAGHGVGVCMDNGGRLVAMASAARQLHGQLKSYASIESRPEFLEGLLEAIDEFKRCCITPADLLSASKNSEGVIAQKLEELSLLFETYNAICQQGKRDPRDQMTWLLEQLEDCDFAQTHTFYIDGFPDFTRQHMAILEHLISASQRVVVSLNCNEINSALPAFEKAGLTAAEIVRSTKHAGIPMEIREIPGREDALKAVRTYLFNGQTTFSPQLENKLLVYRTKSVYDECVAAADRISELVQQGTRYKEIGVVCADINSYRNTLKMVFDRCNVPSYLSGADSVLEKSAIVTLLSAIDVATGDFEQADVFRYMKSVLAPLDIHACDQVENYAIMWNIQGKKWLSDWCNHPMGLKSQWSEYDHKKLEELNHYRKGIIEPIVKLQQQLSASTSIKQQVYAVYGFLEDIHFADRLSSLAQSMDHCGDKRNAQILNQLWEILLAALEQLHDVLGETSWAQDSFTRLLRLLLSQYNVGTIPAVLDAVTVGPVSAMRCQQVKHLIVLGALEGALPSYCGSRGVLSDQERTALRDLGLPLTGGAMEGIQAEFAEIYGVFCGAEETISISCPSGQISVIYRRLLGLAGKEECIDISLDTAFGNRTEAAAFFVRHGDCLSAQKLSIDEIYTDISSRSQYAFGEIERDTIRELYGERLTLSASQVDKQASCRLAYFLRYGLQVKERKTVTVDPAEFGTYVHAVLEETVREVMALGGFGAVCLEQTMEIAKKHAEDYTQKHFTQLDSERLAYLFRRNSQELDFIVKELWEELSNSQFAPVGFEVEFSEESRIGAIQIPGHTMEAQLRGFVDRVDVWQNGNKQYYKVVDYKTGKKDFDYCDIYNGIGLQMLLYLFALEDGGKFLVGDNASAVGVQYFPARAPFILVDGVEDVSAIVESRAKAWKRKGLLLSDSDVISAIDADPASTRLCCTIKKDGTISGDVADTAQFKLLRAYVFSLLGNIVDEIASGCVEPNPYTRGSNDNACRFCPYGHICHPETVEGRRNYKTITAQRFWEDIEKAVNSNG